MGSDIRVAVLKLIFYEHGVTGFPALIVFACNDSRPTM